MAFHWGSAVGCAGAAGFVVGDILLLAAEPDPERNPILKRDDVDEKSGAMLPFSAGRLRAGALAGVLGAPLQLVGALDQARGLATRPGEKGWVSAAVLLAAAGQPLAAFIHGMFSPWAEALKEADRAERSGESRDNVDRLIAQAKGIERSIEIPYAAYFAVDIAYSVIALTRIARGTSQYPRWSAPLIAPALPAAVWTAVTASHIVDHPAARSLQGAGLSLGNATSFLASAVLRRAPL